MMFGLLGAAILASSVPAFADDAIEAADDPWESFNRASFDFNMTVDRYLLAPVARGYKAVTPDPVRSGVHNFLTNLRSPVILLNTLLQGDFDRSGLVLKRFVVNSTAGLGGLIDVAQDTGDMPVREDFGQTLAVWGAGEGIFIMWPLLGPSTPRDSVGAAVDVVSDPLFWMAMRSEWDLAEPLGYVRYGMTVIDNRVPLLGPLEEMERTSVDFYVAVRDYYRQQRHLDILNRSPAERPGAGEGYRFNFSPES